MQGKRSTSEAKIPLRRQPDTTVLKTRMLAGFIDLVILSIAQYDIECTFGGIQPIHNTNSILLGGGFSAYISNIPTLYPFWLYLIVIIYFFVQEALFGTTIGKSICGLQVVTIDGEKITFYRAFVRNLLRPLDAWPGLYVVGIFSAGVSPLRQRLGDRAAGTIVVRTKSVPQAVLLYSTILHRMIILLLVVGAFAGYCEYYCYYQRPPLVIESWKNSNNSEYSDMVGSTQIKNVSVCGKTDDTPGHITVGQSIENYLLTDPKRDDKTITYPISFVLKGQNGKACWGNITLHWNGFFGGGWQVVDLSKTSE